MNKKIILIAVGAILIVFSIVAWNFLYEEKFTQQPVSNKANDIEMNIVTLARITDFKGIKMKTYQNKNGYEISYPSYWSELDLADTYGDQRDLNANHYFSPTKINKELHQLLLKPIGCEGEGGCEKYFEKYSKTEYSLFEIYVQKFDQGLKFPDIQIPDAQKKQIIFPDGTNGIMWNQNSDETYFIIADNIIHNYRYQIKIRNPLDYGLNFEKDILPILSTFKIIE